ncbi:MAG: metal-dependent hydrolase [Haloferacaceae archaeon]
MTDLLTHVLVAYLLATLVERRTSRLDRRHVPVVMVGALVPDVAKVHLVLGDPVSAVAGVDASWYALQTVGGVAALVAIGAVLIGPDERRRALGLLAAGAASHMLLDVPVQRADGLSPPYLYPLTWWRVPSLDLYLSSDVWPALVAVAAVAALFIVRRCRRHTSGDSEAGRVR